MSNDFERGYDAGFKAGFEAGRKPMQPVFAQDPNGSPHGMAPRPVGLSSDCGCAPGVFCTNRSCPRVVSVAPSVSYTIG